MTPRQKQTVLIFRAHKFCIRLQGARFPFLQALGGLGMNMLMGYVYFSTLKEGEKLWRKQNAPSAKKQSGKPTQPAPRAGQI